ncbi:MAG: RNA-directed DNA polymerase [Alphaproteobacteria bacterium]
MEYLFDINEDKTISLEDLFQAYYDCRKNKRTKKTALMFEQDYEDNLISLWKDINDYKYFPQQSSCFIVNKPVKREIFAAEFKDRVVHHLLINKTIDIFEKYFIKDSYSCRYGKGTLYGQKEIYKKISECSNNYTTDCYVLKLDIKAFFMNIDKVLLYKMVKKILIEYYKKPDLKIILYLYEKVIFNNPTLNANICSNIKDWNTLPKDKSMFFSKKNKGLAIGNLTSQILANIYLTQLDYFIKHKLKIKYYGRYVDDFVLIDKDKQFLLLQINLIKEFLYKDLGLILHPKKIYIQHYSKGLLYIGGYLKQNRVYVGNRTKTNFYNKIMYLNNQPIDDNLLKDVRNCVNSYLGLMRHYNSFNIRRKAINMLSLPIMKNFKYTTSCKKISLKGSRDYYDQFLLGGDCNRKKPYKFSRMPS